MLVALLFEGQIMRAGAECAAWRSIEVEAKVLEERDAFSVAETHFRTIVDGLRFQESAAMDLSDLEKKLKAEGNRLMQELLQGHMELRS